MLEPNQIFAGRYRIVRHLADGGMGVIFEAEHLATEAHVALKLLWPHVMQVASARQRFELEAKVAARVNSEHIVRVLDAGFDPKTRAAYLVMELLLGSTLAASVKTHGAMSPGLTVALMRQMARGLDAAHGYRSPAGVLQPIVHRDLKPENLFLCARPEGLPLLKILDFGIAKVVRETANVSRDLRGTPAYMAYEQVTGETLSPQTDIWALGLITYYALTARAYWPSANQPTAGMQALFAEILTLPLPRASERIREDGLDINLPRAFDAWLLGCIARKASQRFASAGEAIDALELVLRAPASLEAAPAETHVAEAKRFTELAYATTAVLQGGAAWPTGSHSVAGVASERSHLAGSPRRVVLVSVVVFALTLVGLAWHFAATDANRRALTNSAGGEVPAFPGTGSALAPLDSAVQNAQPAPHLIPPAPPRRADAGDASARAAPVEPDAGISKPFGTPSDELAFERLRPSPAPRSAPRARSVDPRPEAPAPPREPPPRSPAPEPPPTPPVIPREPPEEPAPEPPAPPSPDEPAPPSPDEPAPPSPDEPAPPSPDEPAPEPPPDEEPPEEPPEEAPPEPPPDEEPPDEPPEEAPPDSPDEPPSEEPPDEPCTFDPYTGRCSPSLK